MILLVFLLLFYQLVIADIQQHYVVINCSWPCPSISDACILTKESAQCQAKGTNDWVITSPSKAPVYTGAYSSVENHSCVPAPIPELPIYQNTTVLTEGQTVIQWPIVSLYLSLDEYLGSCNHGMYCSYTSDKGNICQRGYGPGSKCVSSNQCRRGYCTSNTCYQRSTQGDEKTGQQSSNHDEENKTKRTVIIVACIVSILCAFGIIVLAIVIFRYHRRRLGRAENNKDFNLFNEISDFDRSSLKNQIKEVSSQETVIERDITPSMQQNVLQKELLKSHHQNHAKPTFHQI